MNRNELEYFEKIIHEMQQDVLRSISATDSINIGKRTHPNGGEFSQYRTHIADQGSDSMGREESFMLISRELEYLARIDDALRNIDKGQYGKCKICGKRIPHERLIAVPTTDTCVTCKTFKKSEFIFN